MSERADLDRTMRQMWARSGSSHDRLVRILRFGLPLVIGVVAAVLVFSPFTQRAEIKLAELRKAYADQPNSQGVRIGKVSDVRARINSKTYPEGENLDKIVDRLLHDLEH